MVNGLICNESLERFPRNGRRNGRRGNGFWNGDRMFNIRITIDMSFRFRFALLLCAFIILVNVLFKVQTDFVEMAIYKQSKTAFYRPTDAKADPLVENVERGGTKESQQDVGNHLVRRQAKESVEEVNPDKISKDTKVDAVRQDSEGQCQSGHIDGLSPVCDTSGCLSLLVHISQQSSPNQAEVPKAARRRINYIPGWMDSTHISLISLVTAMQWNENIYGTLGELIAGIGKLTSLFTYNVDHSAGELLFVADDFVRASGKYQSEDSSMLYDLFVENVSQSGYTITDMSSQLAPSRDTKTIYLHRGNILDVNKASLRKHGVPQFRLLAVDCGVMAPDSVTSTSSLVLASCLLRDGGLLVVDGIDSPETSVQVLNSLSHYFVNIQSSRVVLTPLLSARNKLYLTTVDYKFRYSEYLLQYGARTLGVAPREVTTSLFGREFTYLLLD